MSARGTAAASDLQIWVDPDGSAYLQNTTGGPISFDGYQIASETNRLDPVGWKSIADYVAGGEIAEVIAALGPGGLTFGEANPGPGNLAELNLGGAGTLLGGAKFYIGKPFLDGQRGTVGADGFFYKLGGSSQFGDIVPEPSTFVLAALAGAGLLGVRAMRYRR
ncbi:MAG: PEP-CTERM sorting domain-containing protein [Pirellulales bacterium]